LANYDFLPSNEKNITTEAKERRNQNNQKEKEFGGYFHCGEGSNPPLVHILS